MTTEEILKRLREIDDLSNMVNEESGEFKYSESEIDKMYEDINATKEEKLIAIEDYKRKLQKEIEFYNEKKAKQDANIKRTNGTITYLKELQMDLLGGEKLKTDEYTFSYRKAKSIHVPEKVDKGFKDCVEVKYEWDKTAIKKMLDTGIDYSEYDIYFEEKMSLLVR